MSSRPGNLATFCPARLAGHAAVPVAAEEQGRPPSTAAGAAGPSGGNAFGGRQGLYDK